MPEQSIVVVDLRDFTSPSPEVQRSFVNRLGDALSDIGFFAVTHHGVDQALIKQAYAQAQAFFELPAETKAAYEDLALKGQRGFTSFGRENAKGSDAKDLKEFWHVGRELPLEHPDLPKFGVNLWPTELVQFKPVMLELYRQLETCAMTLLRAMAVYLDEPETVFTDMTHHGDTVLRVIHYPPLEPNRDPGSLRAAAHEDINLITLLCESTDAGLELLQNDGRWRPIHALEGQIIVDTGDMMQNLTNGYFKSTRHRVTNPGNDRSRRFSMPFFVHPRSETSLSPLPKSIVKSAQPKQFKDWTAGEYLAERLAEIGLDASK